MPNITEADLKCADIIFTRNNGMIGKMIRFFTSMQTGKAYFNHVAIALGGVDGLCIESLSRVRINPVREYENKKTEYIVYRLPLTDKQRGAFKDGILTKAGDNYGYGKIALFALDGTVTGIKKLFGMKNPCFWFTKHFGILNIQVCSELAVYGLKKWAGMEFKDAAGRPVDWRIVSPDYLQDLILAINCPVICSKNNQKP